MKVTRGLGNDRLNIRLEERGIEEVNVFRYFGVELLANGYMKDEVNHRVEGVKRWVMH